MNIRVLAHRFPVANPNLRMCDGSAVTRSGSSGPGHGEPRDLKEDDLVRKKKEGLDNGNGMDLE